MLLQLLAEFAMGVAWKRYPLLRKTTWTIFLLVLLAAIVSIVRTRLGH